MFIHFLFRFQVSRHCLWSTYLHASLPIPFFTNSLIPTQCSSTKNTISTIMFYFQNHIILMSYDSELCLLYWISFQYFKTSLPFHYSVIEFYLLSSNSLHAALTLQFYDSQVQPNISTKSPNYFSFIFILTNDYAYAMDKEYLNFVLIN